MQSQEKASSEIGLQTQLNEMKLSTISHHGRLTPIVTWFNALLAVSRPGKPQQ